MSEIGIFRQLAADRVGWIGTPARPVYDSVEVSLLTPFGVLFVEPVLQSKPVAVNIKADVDFTQAVVNGDISFHGINLRQF